MSSKSFIRDYKKSKMKQLIKYISTGALILILLIIIIALVTRYKAKKEIIPKNKAKKEILVEDDTQKDLLENGYYYLLNDDHKGNNLFRFYKASNKVISTTAHSLLSEIKFVDLFPTGNWFNEDFEHSAQYSMSGNKIAFSFGEVHFNGTLLEDGQKLELSYHSDTNGIEDTKIFKFISLDVLEDIQDLDLIHN